MMWTWVRGQLRGRVGHALTLQVSHTGQVLGESAAKYTKLPCSRITLRLGVLLGVVGG